MVEEVKEGIKSYKTIDEKIDAVIDWRKKYPNMKLTSVRPHQPISERTMEELEEIAEKEGIEFTELFEKYKIIQACDEYIRSRERSGNLTEEQWKKCKEGNLKGKFGYPTSTEELADKLKMEASKLDKLLARYGNLDNFIGAFFAGIADPQEVADFINNVIDIDFSEHLENYIMLLRDIFGKDFINKNRIIFFSSGAINEVLETLDPRSIKIIEERYGLKTGKTSTDKVIGESMDLTRERIRQILEQNLNKLRTSPNSNAFRPISIEDLMQSKRLKDFEYLAVIELRSYILRNNLILGHSSIDNEADKKRFDIIRSLRPKVEFINSTGIPIEQMRLSMKLYTSLRNGGFKTAEQIAEKRKSEIMLVNHIGETLIKELEEKLKLLGLQFIPEKKEVRVVKEELNVSIDDLGFPNRVSNCLKRAGIGTVRELIEKTEKELLGYNNLGNKIIREIKEKLDSLGLSLAEERIKPGRKSIKNFDRNGESSKKENQKSESQGTLISELGLSVRLTGVLERNEIFTIEDLQRMSKSEILNLDCMGKKSYEELIKKLQEKGVSGFWQLANVSILQKPIYELPFSSRVINALIRGDNYKTLEDICQRTEEEIMNCPGIGKKALEEIKSVLNFLGVKLAEEELKKKGKDRSPKPEDSSELSRLSSEKRKLQEEQDKARGHQNSAEELYGKYAELSEKGEINHSLD